MGWEQEASEEGGAGLHQTRDKRGLGVRLASFAGLSPFNSFIVITPKMPLYIERAKQQLCLGGGGNERMRGQAQRGGGSRRQERKGNQTGRRVIARGDWS